MTEAGGFGFPAAGYKTAEQVQLDIAGTRRLTSEPFGVNVFVPRPSMADAGAVAAYLAGLRGADGKAAPSRRRNGRRSARGATHLSR